MESPKTTTKFFTVYEIAQLLNCTPGAVRKWIRSKRLVAVYAGRLVRVRSADLESFLKSE